jgi:nickel/cobalt transporter (NicO) family protein
MDLEKPLLKYPLARISNKILNMYQIFLGSLTLSIIHALIPNHWLPLIAIGKTENWSTGRTLWATVITGFAHTLSTIIVGIVVGLIGYKLADNYVVISEIVAPSILICIGIIYVLLDLRHGHHHSHHQHAVPKTNPGKSSWIAILTSLSIAMFLTPCIEIEAYYFRAGTIGWMGIFIVSAVYLLVTILVMVLLVFLGLNGVSALKSHFLEHHEKLLTGVVLVLLGLIAFFYK